MSLACPIQRHSPSSCQVTQARGEAGKKLKRSKCPRVEPSVSRAITQKTQPWRPGSGQSIREIVLSLNVAHFP